MGGDISRLRSQIRDTNDQITQDTLSKNKMIDDIRRYADLNDSVNPKPDIPPSEIVQIPVSSTVVDSYGIPIILGSGINLDNKPSGFDTSLNTGIITDTTKYNQHADTKYIPDSTNKYLATDQYYYQQGQLYQTATNNDMNVKTNLTNYINNLKNPVKTTVDTQNTALGRTNLTGVEYSFAQVQQQNSTIENQIEQNLTTHATLNEKALFQEKEIDTYKYTNYYLFIAFYILLAILGVVLFTLNFSLSFYVKIAILCVLAIYPFVVGLLYQLLVILWKFLGAIALGNVYNKRNDVTGQANKNEVQP